MNIKIINPNSLPVIDYRKVKPIQGSLKSFTTENRDKLINSINKFGFFVPLFLWKYIDGYYSIDGHHRVLALKHMQAKPYKVPYIDVEAENVEEAKSKLLVISSAYAKVTQSGLKEFTMGMDMDMVIDMVNFDSVGVDFKLEEPATEPKKKITNHGYSKFDLMISKENKAELIRVLEYVKVKLDTDKTEDALMEIINHYTKSFNV